MSRVTVELGRDDEGKKYVIHVSVYSHKKKGLNATTPLDPGRFSTSDALFLAVYAAGAACAEYLGEKYGENHDPAQCGRAAQEDFRRECLLSEQLKQGLEAKVAKLRTNPLLDVKVQQRLDILQFQLRRGASPAPSDVAWVNQLLVQLSRRQR